MGAVTIASAESMQKKAFILLPRIAAQPIITHAQQAVKRGTLLAV